MNNEYSKVVRILGLVVVFGLTTGLRTLESPQYSSHSNSQRVPAAVQSGEVYDTGWQTEPNLESSRRPASVSETLTPTDAYKYGIQQHSIIATKDGYFPSKIIVRKNIPVHLYLTTTESRDLCFMMEDFNIKKGISSKNMSRIQFHPKQAGPHSFHCPINNLRGTIIVRD